MTLLKTAVFILALSMTSAAAQGGDISPEGVVRANAGQPTRGSAKTFVGSVEVRPVVSPQPPGRTSIGAVTFSGVRAGIGIRTLRAKRCMSWMVAVGSA